eukprot:520369_1
MFVNKWVHFSSTLWSNISLLLYGYSREAVNTTAVVSDDIIKIIYSYIEAINFGIVLISNKDLYIGTVDDKYFEIKYLYSKSVSFRKKHCRCGPSRVRLQRLRIEARHNHVKLAALKMNQIFNNFNVSKVVISGNYLFPHRLYKSSLLNPNIKSLITDVIDTWYGGKFGFMETVNKIFNPIHDKLLNDIMNIINDKYDIGLVTIGIEDTLKAFELNCVNYVILSSEYHFRIAKSMLNKFYDDIDSDSMGILSMCDYLKLLCRRDNAKLITVGGDSRLLNQFVKGLHGCVAILNRPISSKICKNI